MTKMPISADSHITEPPGTYVDRIDPKYRDRAPCMKYDENVGDVMLIDGGHSVVPFGIIAAAGTALLADSDAMMPSGAPCPNRSGLGEIFCAQV